MFEIKTLLPELRKLVVELAEDLLARSIADSEIDAGLREAFQQIQEGGRTAQAFEVWREDYLDQVAVAWVLACVFVRFMEDNGLIDECWLAGEGERRRLAEDTHTLFFREHAHDTDREYFQHVFKEVGKIPAAKDLFAEGKTPLWAVAPSGDAAMKLLKFWREMEPETGKLKREFNHEIHESHEKESKTDSSSFRVFSVFRGSDPTRFLGDLYQELSERAKKKFALLQTPVFVEEFILDRTLTPALAEFGLEKVRMIDPTCGSGHFLLGGFARLFDLWSRPDHTTGNAEKDAQKALDGVWGVDINPFAVAIARFRLIVAAVQACGIKRLKKAPGWNIHLASGDSLLFGCRWNPDGTKRPETRFLDDSWAPDIYACEDKVAVNEVLGQQYHVVVGNPPYIIVRDRQLNNTYRERYRTCHQKYSLAVPFAERFFDLCYTNGTGGSGYVGQITANSFMKREFGKKLIEEFFPKIDLTHVIDTSGAYIPGHGTPTVILFGRNRRQSGDAVRAVLGIKGEPSTPDNPSQGQVWRSILSQIDRVGSQDDFTSTADVPRTTFNTHPWSIGGGGAAELKEQIDEAADTTLANLVDSIGFASFPGQDDAFVLDRKSCIRLGFDPNLVRDFVYGEVVRDWQVEVDVAALVPYDKDFRLVKFLPSAGWAKHLWSVRTCLEGVISFGGRTRKEMGDDWWGWYRWIPEKYRRPLSITFAEVASHNHFVLDRGGKVFKQTAPVIKLPADATEGDHLALLGLLNSSTTCFCMKQVSHQKQMMGGDGIRISSRAKVPYQFAGTRMLELPIPKSFSEEDYRDRLQRLATQLDQVSQEMNALTAASAIQQGSLGGEYKILSLFQEFEAKCLKLRSASVFLQEEIDFTSYVMFGLADKSLLCDTSEWPTVTMDAGMRPFEILQQANLDDFSVPKQVPTEWPEELQIVWRRRMETIRNSKDLSLIEDDHYKRRWLGRQGLFNHSARQDELKSACELWLLDRLESPKYRKGTKDSPELTTTAQMADVASADAEFQQVAALYRGRPDFDMAALVAELVEGESVPFLPILRYKPAGLRKREVWERTWDLQRQQDDGKDVGEIPVPPKYAATDFLKTDFWRLRGKLDVPKERWVSYPHCGTDSDPTLVVGWAGWNHLEQATALIAYYDARKREGWDAKRLTPLLAGLDQLLPWIHQWHPEIDAEFGETAGQSFQTMLEHDAHELGLTLDDVRNWTPPEKIKKTPKGRKKKIEAEDDE